MRLASDYPPGSGDDLHAASYANAFRQTGDALGRLLHESAGMLGSVKGWWDGQRGGGATE